LLPSLSFQLTPSLLLALHVLTIIIKHYTPPKEHARVEREAEFHYLLCVFYIIALDDYDVPYAEGQANATRLSSRTSDAKDMLVNTVEHTRLEESFENYVRYCKEPRLKNVTFSILLNKSDR
jgi:hypothetical protein